MIFYCLAQQLLRTEYIRVTDREWRMQQLTPPYFQSQKHCTV